MVYQTELFQIIVRNWFLLNLESSAGRMVLKNVAAENAVKVCLLKLMKINDRGIIKSIISRYLYNLKLSALGDWRVY